MDIESAAEKYWAQVQYKYKCKVVFWGMKVAEIYR